MPSESNESGATVVEATPEVVGATQETTTTVAEPAEDTWSWDEWGGDIDALPVKHRPVFEAAYGHASKAFEAEIEALRELQSQYHRPADPPAKEKALEEYEEWKAAQQELAALRSKFSEIEPQVSSYQEELQHYQEQLQQLEWLQGYYRHETTGWVESTLGNHPYLADDNHPSTRFFMAALKEGHDPNVAVQLLGKAPETQQAYMLDVMRGLPEQFALERALSRRDGARVPDRGIHESAPAYNAPAPANIESLPMKDAIKEALRRARENS